MKENPYHPWVRVGMKVVLLEVDPLSVFHNDIGKIFSVVQSDFDEYPWFRFDNGRSTIGRLLKKIVLAETKSIEDLL